VYDKLSVPRSRGREEGRAELEKSDDAADGNGKGTKWLNDKKRLARVCRCLWWAEDKWFYDGGVGRYFSKEPTRKEEKQTDNHESLIKQATSLLLNFPVRIVCFGLG